MPNRIEKMNGKTICFYAHVSDIEYFQIVEFYHNELIMFKKLGYRVITVNKIIDLLRLKADIYYAYFFGYAIFPLIISKLRRKPFFVCGNVHTNFHPKGSGGLNDWPLWQRQVIKVVLSLSNQTIFTSKTDFIRLDGFKPRNPNIIFPGVDSERYKISDRKRVDAIATITHLTLENIRRKDLLGCLEIFSLVNKILPEAKYYICGTLGNGTELVRDKIGKLNLEKSVFLTGRISNLEKIKILQTVKVYVQPSKCEGFGLALIEAMACGTPVVTNPEPCIVEVNGDVVEYGKDYKEMADKILRLIKNEQYFNSRSLQASRHSQKYSLEKRTEQFERLLNLL